MKPLKYAIPQESGDSSRVKAICRNIGKLLDLLGQINVHVCKGELEKQCYDLRFKVLNGLEAEGWIVTIPKNNYRVKPPADYYKRQYMAETEGRGK